MKKNNYTAILISGDGNLEKLISLLLNLEGIELITAVRADILPSNSTVILDLDRQKLPEKSFRALIGISSDPDSLSEEVKGGCTTVFRRPFSFDAFIAALISIFQNDGNCSVEEQSTDSLPLELYEHERLAVRGTKTVTLTPTETAILARLLSRRGETVTRKEIADIIGGDGLNKATVFLCTLRKKLEQSLDISPISTVRGSGYSIK